MNLAIINTIRTSNFNDDLAMQKVMDLWKGASAILAKHEDIVYGVYYKYASDYTGDFTLSVAIEEENESAIVIPEDAKYRVFKVHTDSEQGVLETWKKIWSQEKNGQLNRAYTYDFEKYYPNGNIDIHIAVK